MPYTRSEQAVLREFGERVRSAREGRGWTQEDLAAEAGLDRTYVGGIERGERNLALLNVNKLAIALGDGFAGFLPCRQRSGRK
ncbi:MAG: helix-turn-helix domain-containing protein [Woeseiaceae bacterium]